MKKRTLTEIPKLSSQRLTIRKLIPSDAKKYFALCSKQELMRPYGVFHHQTIADSVAAIEHFSQECLRNHGLRWGIFLQKNDQLIGDIGYWRFDWPRARAEIGCKIDNTMHRNGYMNEAGRIVIEYGFSTLELNSIEASIAPDNHASRALVEQWGFVLEGHRKNFSYSPYSKSFQDSLLFSLHKETWNMRQPMRPLTRSRTQKTVVIVDGYSSGNFLAPAFKNAGFTPYHVQSTETIFHILKPSFRKADYQDNFCFTGDEKKLADELKQLSPTAIIPGTETGVYLADRLSAALEIKSNGTTLSRARRHKYVMLETLRTQGVAVAQQFSAACPQKLCDWYHNAGITSVVVKPVESAGSEDVYRCNSVGEVKHAAQTILNKVNLLGITNEAVIIQEYLHGDEYFINSVSMHGRHHITDIWLHKKRPLNGYDFVYDCAKLIESQSSGAKEISYYINHVLDALQIQYGPAHAEVMVTPHGIRLIEIGARLQGMLIPAVNQACIGYGPLEMTVDAYTNEAQFLARARIPYRCQKLAVRVNLMAHRSGRLKQFSGEEKIRRLPSFFHLRSIKKAGDFIAPSINYFTIPAFVVLVHKDPHQLDHDIKIIRELESRNEMFAYD